MPHQVETRVEGVMRPVTYVTYRIGQSRDGKETIKELSRKGGWEIVEENSVCPEHIQEFESRELSVLAKEKVIETYLDRKYRFLYSVVQTAEDLERERAEAMFAQTAEAGTQEPDNDSWDPQTITWDPMEEFDDDLF